VAAVQEIQQTSEWRTEQDQDTSRRTTQSPYQAQSLSLQHQLQAWHPTSHTYHVTLTIECQIFSRVVKENFHKFINSTFSVRYGILGFNVPLDTV